MDHGLNTTQTHWQPRIYPLEKMYQDALPLADILREYIHQNSTAQLSVSSDSMLPLLRVGDILGLEAAPESQLHPGTIITFETAWREHGLVTHRIASTWRDKEGHLHLLTRGDRMLQFDQPLTSEQVIGIVTWRARNGRLVRLDRGQGARLNRKLDSIAGTAWQLISGRPLEPYPRTSDAVTRTNELALGRRNVLHAPLVRALSLAYGRALSLALLPFAEQQEFRGAAFDRTN
jgi:signal peptidase I